MTARTSFKKRFIEGLPRLLKDRVFLALGKEYQYQVPYKNISYDELIKIII